MKLKPANTLLHLAASLVVVQAAINLDGSKVVDPVSEDDPSPIGDPLTYIPDQHNCPLQCDVDISNVHKWTPYHSLERLERCELPMLVQFSVPLALDDPKTNVLIRSCTLVPDPESVGDRTIANASAIKMDNPKADSTLLEVSLDVAPACVIGGKETNSKLSLSTSGGQGLASNVGDVRGLLDGLSDFFAAKDNCDESFVAAVHKKTVAGVFIGPGLGKATVKSALNAVSDHFSGSASMNNRTIAQVCGSGSKAQTIFGVSVDTTGNLAWIQKTAAVWNQGKCATVADDATGGSSTGSQTLNIKVFDIATAPLDDILAGNFTTPTNSSILTRGIRQRTARQPRWKSMFNKRATCSYVQVVAGDGCASLAAKCGISGSEFMTYNTKSDLCATLQADDYVCCSAGDPYEPPKPDAPQQQADGTCATHLIQTTDTCSDLATKHGLTVEQIEGFNKGKTWGWTKCADMLAGYNLCLSEGSPPLPPPQQGAECGPLVPGTEWTDKSIDMTELNPCPLKACCSNWGFCGPFAAHCEVHAPEGAGPGAKLPEYQSSCVASCGNEIKQNSGHPTTFSRIGYYESWNMNRKCLWQKAENANTDGSYTHMHWGFADIDPTNWKPVLTDPYEQWDAFKKLDLKRIVSFGGWAYSTEKATYNIIREAIIDNAETFATNLAKFVEDEGIDGVDIDWEYPGAPDITVDGQPIGQQGDGVAYLNFLKVLKSKMPDKSVSIAAPASYWYLKAFPIDRISAEIDYIVYMTYDLHGQWDYGNPNAFDQCDSGKCIRSHVNLTETLNSLSIITKAGVANNKIFVGESSYGRSFHMAVDGCWGPMCEFTGTRLESDAQPGRCTNQAGYIANAEINDLIRTGQAKTFHDHDSNSDILLYGGDFVSYMTPLTKDTRRSEWKGLNFAGSIDWAVDLQAFGQEDVEAPVERPEAGEEGCVAGESDDLNADDLCQFTCNYGFCPEPLCTCLLRGPVEPLPNLVDDKSEFVAWDEFDYQLAQLCKFACKYGFCPQDTCGKPPPPEWEDGSVDPNNVEMDGDPYYASRTRDENRKQCMIFKNGYRSDEELERCRKVCLPQTEAAKAEGRTTNYGCGGFWPLDQPIEYHQFPGTKGDGYMFTHGKCMCDNMVLNFIGDKFIEMLPIIAQVGCYIVMSAVKLVVDIGLSAIPGVGRAIDAGLDAAITAAQLAAYAYDEGEDPAGAFEWWLSPCGGTDLVPDDIKQVFDIMSSVVDGVSSFKKPTNLKKGSGKKGDEGNPTDRAVPKAGNGSGPNGTGNQGVTKKRKCTIKAGQGERIMGKALNTLRTQKCVAAAGGGSTTSKQDLVIVSI